MSGPVARPALPESKETWHIKREVQLGHLLTTLTIVVAAVLYIGRIDQRIALLEAARIAQAERDQRQDVDVSEKLRAVRDQLDRVEQKLDRLIERRAP